MKKIFALACLSIIIFSGCKKTDDCNLTEESLVGTYKLTDLTYRQSPSGSEQNLYILLEDCEKDNLFIFNSNKTFNYQEAGIICNPPLNDASNWSLMGTSLEFAGEMNRVTAYDCKSMVTTISDFNFQGDMLTATYVKL